MPNLARELAADAAPSVIQFPGGRRSVPRSALSNCSHAYEKKSENPVFRMAAGRRLDCIGATVIQYIKYCARFEGNGITGGRDIRALRPIRQEGNAQGENRNGPR